MRRGQDRVRKRQDEGGVAGVGILKINPAAMFLGDPVGDSQTQSDAAPFAVAHEGLEEGVTDSGGHAGAAVGDSQLDQVQASP